MSPLAQILTAYFQKFGIESVVFDLDDTLIDTQFVFHAATRLAVETLCERFSLNYEVVKRAFEECHTEARGVHHVNPEPVWRHTFDLLMLRYPELLADAVEEAYRKMLIGLYYKDILMKEGAVELLTALRELGMPMGIVTNASPEWTLRKIASTNLLEFFTPDRIWTVPPTHHKTAQDWEQAMSYFGFWPRTTLGVGDNGKADIWELQQLGSPTVWIQDENSRVRVGEAVTNELDFTQIISISTFAELPSRLLGRLNENKEPKLNLS